jgi:predicted helicase
MPSTSIHDLLAQYASMARDTREKGLLFERLTKAYLTTDPVWQARYSDVWLWQEWPDRDGKPDTGIDLVAKERYGEGYTAIQAKFYDPTHYLQKSDIDSFFTASGKAPFTSRAIISTTDKWSKHAEDALRGQNVTAFRIGVDDMAESEIDWTRYSLTNPDELDRGAPKRLRPHQIKALADVEVGFETFDRGKLIMACGTGKTFTGLRIAEAVAGSGGSVLFLVPSIALMSQTLKEWSAERQLPLRAFAICSDTKVGKYEEDYSVSDLAYPATTNTAQLLSKVAEGSEPDGLTVYFSTYQSIDVLVRAQAEGLPAFDLVICDEAHRTAGFTLSGKDESSFLRVHDEEAIKADKRLFMTATPKIYAESVRAKATEKDAVLISMDDEDIFGPVFHRLGFGEAVERDLLSDYRVLVLAVDEGEIGSKFQEAWAVEGELNIPDAARIVGIYNGLAKRGVEGLGTSPSALAPLRRAVAFSRSIKDSMKVQSMVDGFDGQLETAAPLVFRDESAVRGADASLKLEAKHVDGTMNVQVRNGMLDWLKADQDPYDNVCRILTNARCLSEGVDVPALDAVIFLNSRDSQVDVVQSVGRVMRKAEGKEYGYIILPIAVAAGQTPEQALNDNAKYKVVWDVLRALRAHDERFEAKIEQIDLNGRSDAQIQIIPVGPDYYGERDIADRLPGEVQVPMDWSAIGADWKAAIYAKIVDKVGERDYWENWAKDVSDIAARQQTRIANLVLGSDAELRGEFENFVGGLQDNLNPSISEADAVEMLSQHLITQPVFNALFDGYSFSAQNPVAQVMQRMVDALEGSRLDTEAESLEPFYESVKRSVSGIKDAAGKQTTIKRLYEKFFSGAFRNTSDRLGIVYTPNEIVDFIIRSADEVLRSEFGASISDEGVHVLDPFTGTGTFIVRLLQSGLIKPEDLQRKYRSELHANELVLLAYYVAAVNIEETFHGLTGGADYEPFPGIILTDTFQSSEDDDRYDDRGIFGDNNERVKAQNALDIRVIIGNPPYSVGQESANDGNENVKYPFLDARIANTYLADRGRGGSNSMYDSYVRAIRWASDRIKDRGIVAFVSNGGFIDGNTAVGLRKSLVDEFSSLYIFNLRGNQRTSGEQSRKEGGKVFGSGSRATVAISVLVKHPEASAQGDLHYRDIGDYLTREQKLALISQYASIGGAPWEELRPNDAGDWLNHRNDAFGSFAPMGEKLPPGQPQSAVFPSYSRGLETGRDAWVYASSRSELVENVLRTVDAYNNLLSQYEQYLRLNPEADRKAAAARFWDPDATKISWTLSLKNRLVAKRRIVFSDEQIVVSSYRPFQKQWAYFDRSLNHILGQTMSSFPVGAGPNFGFYVTAAGSGHSFSAIAVDNIPDLALWGSGSGQFFPRYTYEPHSADGELDLFGDADEAFTRTDNITDAVLTDYRSHYGTGVSKDDIFFFVYGLLHSPDYRLTYASDLKKMLPRIPTLSNPADFHAFAAAGRELSELHLGYEAVEPYPLAEKRTPGAGLLVTKMKFAGKAGAWDRSTVIYNDEITLTGIPVETHDYLLGSRSALEWVLERYRVKTDKDSGIVNDPNDWGIEHGDPEYILNLVKRIVTVSVETVRIVKALPPLQIQES